MVPIILYVSHIHAISAILLDVLGPILVLIAVGAILHWKFRVDLATLSKLNIYLFVPVFVFEKVSTSKLPWDQVGGVIAITVAQVATLGMILWFVGRLFRVRRETLLAISLAVMFYNSGNYGLPLAELAYREEPEKNGAAVQAFVVLVQNVLTYTVGLIIAGMAGAKDWKTAGVKIFRVPVLYTLAAAIIVRQWLGSDSSHHLPIVIGKPAEYISAALVPMALLTVGAQLASNPRWPRWKPVSAAVILRLIFGPIQMIGLLYLFHLTGPRAVDLWPWPAELLILTAAVPTAIGTLLLTLEMGGDTELAADCVFWTTVFSSVTMVGWLLVLRWFF